MSDDALIATMVRAWFESITPMNSDADLMRAALAIARPIIEAQERERCARIAEGRYWSSALGTDGIPKAIAAALKETGDE